MSVHDRLCSVHDTDYVEVSTRGLRCHRTEPIKQVEHQHVSYANPLFWHHFVHVVLFASAMISRVCQPNGELLDTALRLVVKGLVWYS